MGPRGFRRRGRRRGLIVGAAVGSAVARNRNNDDTQLQPDPQNDTDNQMAELEKLGELRDRGILTEEEFQTKKKEVLGL